MQARTPFLCFLSSCSKSPVLTLHIKMLPLFDPQATAESSGLMQGTTLLPPHLSPGFSSTWTVSKLTKSTTLIVLSFPALTRYLSLMGDVTTEET